MCITRACKPAPLCCADCHQMKKWQPLPLHSGAFTMHYSQWERATHLWGGHRGPASGCSASKSSWASSNLAKWNLRAAICWPAKVWTQTAWTSLVPSVSLSKFSSNSYTAVQRILLMPQLFILAFNLKSLHKTVYGLLIEKDMATLLDTHIRVYFPKQKHHGREIVGIVSVVLAPQRHQACWATIN